MPSSAIEGPWGRAKHALWNAVWAVNLSSLGPVQVGLVRTARVSHMVSRELAAGQLTLRAMSLVYTTLLSLVPLLAVSFSVLKGFGVHDQLEPALLKVLTPLGEQASEVTERIVGFVENVRVGLLGSAGLALLVYTVISLLQKVEAAFNYTWRVRHSRPLGQRFSDYLSVLLVGPLLVFSAIGLTAALAQSSVAQGLLAVEEFGWVYRAGSTVLPLLLIAGAFTFAYVFLPNTKVHLRSALAGAVVAGALWQIVGWAFASFVVSTTKTTAIYSGFAILVIFMMWLYLAWLTLLIGASVAFYTQHPEYLGLLADELRISNRMKERLALQSMYMIAQRHYYGLAPIPIVELAAALRVPVDPVREVVSGLAGAQILVEVEGDTPTYAPGRDLALITVEETLDVTRAAEESIHLNQGRLKVEQPVEALYRGVEEAKQTALNGRTWREVAAANPPLGEAPRLGAGERDRSRESPTG